MDKPWHLYKIEVDGELIYIGVTNDVKHRRHAHMAKRWVPLISGKVVVIESYEHRADALKAEVSAIKQHRPVGNFQSNPIGYKSARERDKALYAKLNELEAARWRKLYDAIEAEN